MKEKKTWCKNIFLAGLLFFQTVLAAGLTDDLLLYAPFDGHLDLLVSSGGLLPAVFSRKSVAYTPAMERFSPHQPRYVPGKFQQGIFLESGDYGDYARGTRNNFPPDRTNPALPEGWKTMGQAKAKVEPAIFSGLPAVQVSCQAEGSGVATGEFSLPRAMRYIASVYLKGASGGEKVKLVLTDKTNQVEEAVSVILTANWSRYHLVLPYVEQTKKYGEKILLEPFQAVFSLQSEKPGTFLAACFMLEQAGMYYSNRMTPSTWIPPGSVRSSEVLNLPITPETFHPESGTISFWMFLEPGQFNRTFCSLGAGWDTFINLNEYPAGRLCFTYWGGRNTSALPESGKWHHVALSWSGEKASVYLNGKKTITVTANNFQPDSVWRRHAFLMPGHADSGYPFGAKTHLGGIIDELAVFRRELTEQEIMTLSTAKEPLVILNDVRIRFDMSCRTYSRDLEQVPLRLTLRNFSSRKAEDIRATFSVEKYFPQEVGPFTIPAGGSQNIIYLWPVGRFSPGLYRLQTKISPVSAESFFFLRAGPYRDKNTLPVVAWNIPDSYEDIKLAASLGVTVTSTGVSPFALDWAAECGLSGMSHMHVLAWHKPEKLELAVIQNDGSCDGINPALPEVQAEARNQAREFALSLIDKPSLTHVIINSEWNSPMDFSDRSKSFVLKQYGLDLNKWMTEPKKAWAYLHPYNRLNPTVLGENWFPRDGIVEENDPFYRYHLWWHRGGGNEVVINEICAREIKKVRPDIVRIAEPILRCPPIKRYREMDVAEEWFYYENPRSAIVVQENLACVSASRGMKTSGMPQFLFKPGGAAPYAATPPPEMLREVLWLCAARPLGLMTFWGWHRVLSNKGMLTLSEIEEKTRGLDWKQAVDALKDSGGEGGGLFIPEVKEEFSRFASQVWQPFGPLLMSWRNSPRKIAAINSFAGNLYGNQRWPTMGWLGDVLISTGLPFDVLYDESFAEDRNVLQGKNVVILANTPAVTRTIFEQLQAFARAGGTIIADEKCKVTGLPEMKVFTQEQSPEIENLIKQKAGYPFNVQTREILWNLLEYEGARYLVLVNDKREYGPYLGRWQKVKEKGIAQEVTVAGWEIGKKIFDLTGSQEVQRKTDGSFTFQIGPAEGRILVAVGGMPDTLSLSFTPGKVSRGEKIEMRVKLTGRESSVEGGIPVHLLITEPSGKKHDRSTTLLLVHGQAVFSLVVPVNAETGIWKVQAKERLTGKTEEGRFIVE